MIGAKLIEAAGNGISTVAVAEAIDFDGTNDTLSRTSDLVGNTDGKTFTFSAWVWLDTTGSCQILTAGFVPISFFVSSNIFSIYLESTSGGTRSITMDTNAAQIPRNTFVHILYSADVSSTSLRRLYINDVLVSGVTYTDYNNININWTQSDWSVGGATQLWDGRLSNVYLDKTYRDLTVTANRRLFVTADLKPAADQAALNPILYLPMNDPTAPGVNAGTGGNFTLTGTVARSGRGPNQYNAPLSTFVAASAQTVYKAINLTTTNFTLAFNLRPTTTGSLQSQISYYVNSNSTINLYRTATNGNLVLRYWNGSSYVWSITLPNTSIANRNYNIVISNSSTSLHVSVNGVVTTSSGISSAIPINGTFKIMGDHNTATRDGIIGALWFNTSYIDLSVAANLAKFVTGTGIDAKPVDLGANGELPTGTSPLIYLPMYGNNAGLNKGTGGNFTVNSGPYTGARGPNEFWSGSGLFNNPTQTELSALTLNNSPDVTGVTKTTFAVCFKRRDVDVTDNSVIFNTTSSTNNNFHFSVYFNSSEQLVVGWNGHTVATSSAITDTNWHTLLVSVDSTATVARVYLDNVSVSATITLNRTYTQAFTYVGRATGVSADQCFDGNIGFVYQAHDYIDISQEANRLKFFDAFGYPVNLTQQIEDGAIPAAYVYLLFPESNLGTNNGTAGNFTNASVTASALVKA